MYHCIHQYQCKNAFYVHHFSSSLPYLSYDITSSIISSPSMMMMMLPLFISIQVWHLFSSPTSQYPNAKDLLGFCERHYLYPLQVVRLRALSPARFAFVSYHRLLTHIEETLLHVLDQLYPPSSPSLTMNEPQTPRSYQTALRSYLQSEQARASNFNRHHMHSLAECCNGMTAEEVDRCQCMHLDEISYAPHLSSTLLFYRIEIAKDDSGSSIRAPQGSLPYLSVGGDRGR